jgi:transcriptional regulator with XRE-family HTH domain
LHHRGTSQPRKLPQKSEAKYGILKNGVVHAASNSAQPPQCADMVLAKDIGIRIRKLRLLKRLKQRELGELIGRTEDAVSQMERGINVPTLETLVSVSQALAVSLDELVQPIENLADSDKRRHRLAEAHATLIKMNDRQLDLATKLLEVIVVQEHP